MKFYGWVVIGPGTNRVDFGGDPDQVQDDVQSSYFSDAGYLCPYMDYKCNYDEVKRLCRRLPQLFRALILSATTLHSKDKDKQINCYVTRFNICLNSLEGKVSLALKWLLSSPETTE